MMNFDTNNGLASPSNSQSDTTKDNTIASIVAYFLSRYNARAVSALDCKTTTEAFNKVSELTGSKYSYIKLRRDEFDVFFPDGPRQGWHKRDPVPIVVSFHNQLYPLTFDELKTKVIFLLDMLRQGEPPVEQPIAKEIKLYDEVLIEDLMNSKDNSAGYRYVNKVVKQRVCNTKIVNKLKAYYNYRCQICGQRHFETYSTNISEGHHINPFVESLDNTPSNIIVLCPNHHRLMHSAKPAFNIDAKSFTYPNGYIELIQINDHL